MTLAGVFAGAGVRPRQVRGDAEVSRGFIDSRACVPGSLFVCMPGGTADPHAYIGDAVANGAAAALVFDGAAFEAHPGLPMALLEPAEYPDALWRLMDALYAHPSRGMTLVGVTGTNGKTTTAWLVRQLFTHLGKKAAYLGTLGFSVDGEADRELSNTTPFCVETYDLVAGARDLGAQALAMEVSSHALAQRRVDGLEFDVAVFTNLTQDHLDFHGTMTDYREAKFRLFTALPHYSSKPPAGWVNLDDRAGRELYAYPLEMGIEGFDRGGNDARAEANVRVEARQIGVDGLDLTFWVRRSEGEEYAPHEARLGLGGEFNVENAAAAFSALRTAFPDEPERVARAFASLRPVPGRFEPVPNERGIGVLVDYAHTPDALEKVLDTAKALTRGRLIAVFGCGGDRDRTKRPKMARAASERADLTVVTSDNPRTEDPQAILDEVMGGIAPGREAVAVLDRREAVAYAVAQARPGDTVVIAGKGHETYQILGRTKVHMDDRELAREALDALRAR